MKYHLITITDVEIDLIVIDWLVGIDLLTIHTIKHNNILWKMCKMHHLKKYKNVLYVLTFINNESDGLFMSLCVFR